MQLFLVLAESELPSTEKASLPKKSVLSRLSFIPVLCCQTTRDGTLYGKKLLRPSRPSAVRAAGTQDQGHTSWPIALPRHAALCPRGPAWICPCRHMLSPYLTSARRPGSSSASVCTLSAPLHCWPSLRAGAIWAANLPSAALSSQQPALYQKPAAGTPLPSRCGSRRFGADLSNATIRTLLPG